MICDLKGAPYTFKFDETTTSQVKKQYDAYVLHYSNQFKKVTTAYVGSLFVGHCTAADLLDYFFEFVRSLNLDTNLLLAIGMDDQNVNKSFEKN